MSFKSIPFSLSNVPNVVPIVLPMHPHVVPHILPHIPSPESEPKRMGQWKVCSRIKFYLGRVESSKLSNLGVLKVSKLSTLGVLKVLETPFL